MPRVSGGKVLQPRGERAVQVVLEIDPRRGCFMDELRGDITDLELHFAEGNCHCDVTVCSDGECPEVIHHTGEVCDVCPGIVFSEYDCVPRFIDRREDAFMIRTFLQDAAEISPLVAELREVCAGVRVQRILPNDTEETMRLAREVDLSQLTQKQREALEHAFRVGYYDIPADASLEDVAAAFDVSRSALSQRLARAERGIIGQLFDEGPI